MQSAQQASQSNQAGQEPYGGSMGGMFGTQQTNPDGVVNGLFGSALREGNDAVGMTPEQQAFFDNMTPEQVRKGEAPELTGYQEITCHLVFDVKMDFTRKARFVANGSKTDTPSSITYSSVVSRDSVA